MPGKFENKFFSEIDLNDSFFDSLKRDYPEFSTWFQKKSKEERKALVFSDECGLGAFIALKRENEPLYMVKKTLKTKPRMKISTLKLAERFRGQRLGEGAFGLILWDWQKSKLEEIYVTVFPKHKNLIILLNTFGFQEIGTNEREELIFMRSRKNIDYSTPYSAFPFIPPDFQKGGYLIVEDRYHDTLFPYSELKNTNQQILEKDVVNGISKVYVGKQWSVHYNIGEPVFIYRKYTGVTGTKRYKSCLTSYCVITDILEAKHNGIEIMKFEDVCDRIGNKSVFSKADLLEKYKNDRNVTIIQLLYYGYFGSGNNINMDWLDNNDLWCKHNQYPADIKLTPDQCSTIWNKGEVDIDNLLL